MELSAKKTRDGKRDYLRVARSLRDKLDGLITSGVTDLGTQRKFFFDVSQEELDLVLANNKATHRYDEISPCTHSCCEHEQVLSPALWSTLPMELLQRVFAKLPFPNICRLKSLSKEWQLSLESSSSEFTVALKEFSPKILARVTWDGGSGFFLQVLDGRNNRWYESRAYVADCPANRRIVDMSTVGCWEYMSGAEDAGLVCWVDKDWNYWMFVINPMTGVVKKLPFCHLLAYSELTMMRLVVDRNTYHYKVIIVNHGPPVEAKVYDSEVQQWTKPKPSLGRIFGIAHAWRKQKAFARAHRLGPCAYDCRDGKYYDFGQDQDKWLGENVISYALMNDRLFVLYWDRREKAAFISEYRVPENATSWVKEETYSCFPGFFWYPGVSQLSSRIHACSGFLLVFQWPSDPNQKHENGWVYDLATCEWRALPRVPWCSTELHSEYLLTAGMCELHWNIRP